MWTIEPLLPMGLWWALATLSVAAIALYVLRPDWSIGRRQRVVVTMMMVIGLACPLLVALNPVHVEPLSSPSGKPKLTVLLDGSASMAVKDALQDAAVSRWQRGLELADSVTPDRSDIEVVKQVFFADEALPLPEPDADRIAGNQDSLGQRTDLASALGSVIRNGSPLGHAVLLISDGANNVGSSQSVLSRAKEANALATPIYTLALGSRVGMKNLSVASRSPRMIAFPDQDLILPIQLGHSGLAGMTTQVQLLDETGVIDQQSVLLSDDPNHQIRFSISGGPQQSIQRYRILATSVAGEATTSDNETTILVQRLDAPIDVLLLEGKPYWDSKFLSRNLTSDPMVRLTSIVQLTPNRYLKRRVEGASEGGPSTTSSAASSSVLSSNTGASDWRVESQLASPLEDLNRLQDYRMVVLGRDADRFLTPTGIENLRTWIAKSGGCLLCARGAPSNEIAARLAEILPVRWVGDAETRFRTRVTQHGFDSAVFDPFLSDGRDPLGSLPSLSSSAVPESRRGLPQVLIQSIADREGRSVPVVTRQPYGSGQTIVVEGAGMWRWAFLPPEHADKDEVYWSLWQSLIAWVISSQDFLPGQAVAIRPDRATFLTGDRITASLMVRESSDATSTPDPFELSVLLESEPGTLPQRFQPVAVGLENDFYRVDFGNLDVGLHSARVVRGDDDQVIAETSIEVRDPWFENLEVDARPDLMRGIARESGGDVIPPDEIQTLVDRFEQRLKAGQNVRVRRTTLWDHPLIFLTILGGWMTTWFVRRRFGLV